MSSPSAGAAAEGSRMNEALQRVIRKGGRGKVWGLPAGRPPYAPFI